MWRRPKVSKLTKGLSVEQAARLIADAEARQRDLLCLKANGQMDDGAARELLVLTSRIATMKRDMRHKSIRRSERALEKDGDTGGLIGLKTSRLNPLANTGAEMVRRALEEVIATGVWPEVASDPSAPPLMRSAYTVFEQLRKQSGGTPPKSDPILNAIVAREVEQMVRVATKVDTALRKLKKSKPKDFAK